MPFRCCFKKQSILFLCSMKKPPLACLLLFRKPFLACNGTRTHNHIVRKWTFKQAILVKCLSVRLRTKWLWVCVLLQSLKLQISRLFCARSSLTFSNSRVWIHSKTRTWHDKNIQSFLELMRMSFGRKHLNFKTKILWIWILISSHVFGFKFCVQGLGSEFRFSLWVKSLGPR